MASSSRDRAWFITGASSGFGRELARRVLARGERVFATARRPETLAEFAQYGERSAIAALDVTKSVEVASAVSAANAMFGGIDVLVNCAGYVQAGAVEEVSDADSRKQFDVNFFGLVEVIRAALPRMRERGRGCIVNFSSLAGILGMAGAGNYCASKFALEGLSETLAMELAPLGIKVMLVEPGAFLTNLTPALQAPPENPAYAATVGQLRQWLAANPAGHGGDPGAAMEVLINALDAETPPLRLLLGQDALESALAKVDALRREFEACSGMARV